MCDLMLGVHGISNPRGAIIAASAVGNYMLSITTHFHCALQRAKPTNSTTALPLHMERENQSASRCWPRHETGSSQRSPPQMQRNQDQLQTPAGVFPPSRAPITGHRCLGVPLVVLRRSAAQRPLRTAAEGGLQGRFQDGGAKDSRTVRGLRD